MKNSIYLWFCALGCVIFCSGLQATDVLFRILTPIVGLILALFAIAFFVSSEIRDTIRNAKD
jgi:arginine exporter protein ArgO